jgi:nucleoside-diphosphate-sugar epimerase
LKLLVTGADGFTGRHFVTLARERGHVVHALQANVLDAAGLRDEVAQCAPDAVVHLAAISFVGHADASAFYSVNVVGTTNLLQAVCEVARDVQRVVVASSANVYGNCTVSPIGEGMAPAPVNHYAVSKLAMEHMAGTFADRLPVVVARPFNYTGVGQGLDFLVPKLVSHFARREPKVVLGNLAVEREFNDVALVCEAYLRLMVDGEVGGTYNICSGVPHALESVVDTLAELTGHQISVEVNPAFVRANEVFRLCGDPGRLVGLLGAGAVAGGADLRKTLATMLSAMDPLSGRWLGADVPPSPRREGASLTNDKIREKTRCVDPCD